MEKKIIKKYDQGNGQWILNNFQRMREGWKPVPAVRNCIFSGAMALGIEIPEDIFRAGRKWN